MLQQLWQQYLYTCMFKSAPLSHFINTGDSAERWPSRAKRAPFALMNQLFSWPVPINIFVCVDSAVYWGKEADARSCVHFCSVQSCPAFPPAQALFVLQEGEQLGEGSGELCCWF